MIRHDIAGKKERKERQSKQARELQVKSRECGIGKATLAPPHYKYPTRLKKPANRARRHR
jgi:hypothetical protein